MDKFDILVFTETPTAYGPKRLIEEGKKIGLKIDLISYKHIDFDINDGAIDVTWNGKVLPEAKSVVFRELNPKALAYNHRNFLIEYYQQKGSYVLNAISYLKWTYLDKLTQNLEFQKSVIPFIKSWNFGSRNSYIEWAKSNYPFIAKYHISSKGREVFKVTSEADLWDLFNQGYKPRGLLAQEFIKVGEDLRVIVLGGEVVGAMMRVAKKGSHLTNFSQGGSVVPYDISKDSEASGIAIKASKHFYLDYVGVDLMRGNDGKWKVLEVNRGCQFKGFESATGINVAERLIQFLLTKKIQDIML